jgi:hypothetical protein
MKREAVLDRIEDASAVLELEGAELRIPRDWLPPSAREGDALTIAVQRRGGRARIEIARDASGTRRARADAESLLRKLRGP